MKKTISLLIIFSLIHVAVFAKVDALKEYSKFMQRIEKTVKKSKKSHNDSGFYIMPYKVDPEKMDSIKKMYHDRASGLAIEVVKWSEKQVDFIIPDEFLGYCYSSLNLNETPLPDIKNKGKAFVVRDLISNTILKEIEDIRWSGEVVDGKLHGEGVGIYRLRGIEREGIPTMGELCVIKGKFDHGYPVGKYNIRMFNYDNDQKIGRFIVESNAVISEFKDNYATIRFNQNPFTFVFNKNGEGGLSEESKRQLKYTVPYSILEDYRRYFVSQNVTSDPIYFSPDSMLLSGLPIEYFYHKKYGDIYEGDPTRDIDFFGPRKVRTFKGFYDKNPALFQNAVDKLAGAGLFWGVIKDISLDYKVNDGLYEWRARILANYLKYDKSSPEKKLDFIFNKGMAKTVKGSETYYEKGKRKRREWEKKEIDAVLNVRNVVIDDETKETVDIKKTLLDLCSKAGRLRDYAFIYEDKEGVDEEALQKEIAEVERQKKEAREKRQAEEYAFLIQHTPEELMDKYGFDKKKNYVLRDKYAYHLTVYDFVKNAGRDGANYPYNDLHPKKWYTLSDFKELWETAQYKTYMASLPIKLENWYKKHEVPPLEIPAVRVHRQGGWRSSLAMMLGGDAMPYYYSGTRPPVNVGIFWENDLRIVLSGIALAEGINPSLFQRLQTEEDLYWGFEEEDHLARKQISKDDSYREFMKKAIAVAQKCAETAEHPEYYLAAAKFIKERLEKIIKVTADLRPLWKEVQHDRADRMRAKRIVLCDNCKIDGEKTTFPKGWTEGFSSFFLSRPGESEDAGVIVFKNGFEIKWKYIEDDGKIRYKNLENGKLYDRADDMVSDMIKYCKDMYCD